VDLPLLQQHVSAIHGVFAQEAGDAHGGNLDQASHVHEILQPFRVVLEYRVPLRVGQDGRDVVELHLEEFFLGSRGNHVEGELHQKVPARVVDRGDFFGKDLLCQTGADVDLRSHAHMDVDFVFGQGFAQAGHLFPDPLAGVVIDIVKGVGRRHQGVNAVG